jgi:transglutaminase-like putative cysteine protease
MTTCETKKIFRVAYPGPATGCTRRLRLFPWAQRGSQRILDLEWDCVPQATSWREFADDFGNRVLELHHDHIEHEFRFGMTLTTQRRSCDALHYEGLPKTGVGAFLLPSTLCDQSPEVERAVEYLRNMRQLSEGDAEGAATRLCAWTHRALKYTPGVTHTGTTVSQALAQGAGMCQDYAHLMIALCRAARLPARYISGYNPAEGLMHAWVEVLCDDRWLAWDPTHNRRTRADCVFVACGRDFRDVSPITGSYTGRGGARLQARCLTKVLETASWTAAHA